eukprot:352020-Chlamydomonas_euryale.AAC.8
MKTLGPKHLPLALQGSIEQRKHAIALCRSYCLARRPMRRLDTGTLLGRPRGQQRHAPHGPCMPYDMSEAGS